MSEFEFEPIPGLPEQLPAGERLLWQGSPSWEATRKRVLHVRGVAYYLGAILVLRVVWGLYAGQAAQTIAVSTLWLSGLALATVTFLMWVARLIANGTVYTITTRRVVMRFGIVVPLSVNIPYNIIESAGLREYPDGTGDIPLRLSGDGRMAYPHLWPHARPWAINRAEPMLRGVPGIKATAQILSTALKSASCGSAAGQAVPTHSQPDRVAA